MGFVYLCSQVDTTLVAAFRFTTRGGLYVSRFDAVIREMIKSGRSRSVDP